MMEYLKEVLDSVADILSYPGVEYKQRAAQCRTLCNTIQFLNEDVLRSVLAAWDGFNASIANLSLGELEELYTRTFDINPVSSLEVGWHLHGETYERGAFLVQMRELLRRCNVEESCELPDHLTHALRAVGRMERDEAEGFVSSRLLKAVEKMLEGFAGKGNPYEHVLTATKQILAGMRSCATEQRTEVHSSQGQCAI